ncbi:MAG: nickel-dependent lactate racemase [Candidatus Saccharibacteria bacterium]
MEFSWKYGKDKVHFAVPDQNIISVLQRQIPENAGDAADFIRKAMAQPIGSPTLLDIIKSKHPESVVIVVNDITRPTPYKQMLPPILTELEEGGISADSITLLVATGIHRPHTDQENANIFGPEICEKYRVVNHDCDHGVISLGTLSNGAEMLVNKTAAEADLLITTGLIGLHYIAGYSGGRKSILPGIAGRSSIEFSHAMMADERACLGNIADNPVDIMLKEAALKVGVDYILNVVTDDDKNIIGVVAGDVIQAWEAGVEMCRQASVCQIKERADIVIAGCGGYPKDINVYQSQKALDAAAPAIKDGGVIILVAHCEEGLGEDVFERWVQEASSIQDIKDRFDRKFELGGHKAYAIGRLCERVEIAMVSAMEPELVKKTFMKPFNTVEDALTYAKNKMGADARIYIMPQAPSLAVEVL